MSEMQFKDTTEKCWGDMFIFYIVIVTYKQNKVFWYRRMVTELRFRDLGTASYVIITIYVSHTNKFLYLWISHLEKESHTIVLLIPDGKLEHQIRKYL